MGCGCGESIAEVVGVSRLRGGELYGRWWRGGVGDGKAGFDEYDYGAALRVQCCLAEQN